MWESNRAPISERSKRIRDQYASFQAARQNRPNLMVPPQKFQDRIIQSSENNPNMDSRIDQFRKNAPVIAQRIGQGARTYAQNNQVAMDKFKRFSQEGGYDKLAKAYKDRMDGGGTSQNDDNRRQLLQRPSGNLMAHLQGRRNRWSVNS